MMVARQGRERFGVEGCGLERDGPDNMCAQVLDQLPELRRRREPYRVGHVQRRSAGLDGYGVELGKEGPVGPQRILRRKLHVLHVRASKRHLSPSAASKYTYNTFQTCVKRDVQYLKQVVKEG